MPAAHTSVRLDALRRLELLDAPTDGSFDRLTRLAAAALDAPVAVLSLVDGERQLFRSVHDPAGRLGSMRETPLEHSLCRHVLASARALLIDDARRDDRGAGSPVIDQLGVVAYAGAPLVAPDGRIVGSLCVLDHEPRRWSERDARVLADLAALAMAEAEAGLHAAERRRVHDDLQTMIGQMHALLENLPYLAWVKDVDSRYVAVNGVHARSLGRPMAEIIGRTDSELFPPAVAAEHVASDRAALERGERVSVEERVTERDGVERVYETVKTPFRDASGRWAGTVGVARDITERRAAEEALRASEQHFRALIEQAHDPILIVAADGTLTYASPAFERLFQIPVAEAVGTNGLSLVHPDDLDRALILLSDLVRRPGGRTSTVIRQRRADGEYRTVETVGTNLLDDPAVRGIVVNTRDITERSEADRARHESEERYRRHVQMSPDGIVVHAEGRIVLANPAAARLLGYASADAIVGRSPLDLVHPEDRELVKARVMQLASSGGPVPAVEERLLAADGTPVDVEVVGIPITYGGRQAVQATFRDLRAQKRAAAALHQAEEQLRQSQKMEAVGQLAGGIAHDFNNLLTVIGASTEFLLSDLATTDPRRADVAEIRSAADRATRLTRQLLAFSRKQIMQPTVLDLNGVVRTLQPLLTRLIGEDIVVETVLDPDLGYVMADAGQIEQVIVNLAVNARDAMPTGGRLRIETGNVDVAAGEGGGPAPAGASVMLAVSDTGAGIPAEVRARIFEPFFTTKSAGKGTGLGLATVYGIVSQSGGHVGVRSEPGRGSTFTVYLPRIAAAAADAIVDGLADATPRGSETVLVVEDEDAVRALASRILVRHGFTVLGARNGMQALELAARHAGAIDVVLTDVVMPEMSGRALVEKLSAIRPAVRVVYMSGYTDDDIVRRGILKPGSAFVQKPFSTCSLVKAVRAALADHG